MPGIDQESLQAGRGGLWEAAFGKWSSREPGGTLAFRQNLLRVWKREKIQVRKYSRTKVSPSWGFPGSTSGKEPTSQSRRHQGHGFGPWVGKIPWRGAWQPTPVLLPGESHGQRSLAGYSPRGPKESDTTVALSTHAPPSYRSVGVEMR